MIWLYIFGVLIQLAIPVLVIVGIVWLVKKFSGPSRSTPVISYDESYVRTKVAAEIRAQTVLYKTAAQKAIVEDMAATVEYFATHEYDQKVDVQSIEDNSLIDSSDTMMLAVDANAGQTENRIISQEEYVTPWKKLQVIDGAVILLYLGAFFVIASIGLYVAFGAGEKIKAVLVILLASIFYLAGVFLYRNSTRLRPAGQTFAAIGMATVPMAGAAVYYYAFARNYGPAVWLFTSLAALMLYVHALWVFRSLLVSYMLVFSTISAALSTVPSLGLSQYYFIQALGLSGILSTAISRLLKGKIGAASYDVSAQFLVPLSMLMGILYASRIGWYNFSLSLVTGGVYYAYLAFSPSINKAYYALIAQASSIAALLTFVFAVRGNVASVAWTSSLVAIVYAALWVFKAAKGLPGSPYRAHIKLMILLLPLVSVTFTLGSRDVLWVPVMAVLCTAWLVYAYDHDERSGLLWLVSLLSLPALIGFWAFETRVDVSIVSFIYCGLAVLSVVLRYFRTAQKEELDTMFGQLLLVCSLSIGAFLLIGSGNKTQIIAACVFAALLVFESLKSEQRSTWLNASALTYAAWLLAFTDNKKYLCGYLIAGVVFNIIVRRIRGAGLLHDWLAAIYMYVLPALYGWYIASPTLSSREFLAMYGVLFTALLAIRLFTLPVNKLAFISLYYASLFSALIAAFVAGPAFALFAVFCVAVFHLILEKIENVEIFGYMAPLIPLSYLFIDQKSVLQTLVALSGITLGSLVIAIVRRRSYEAMIAVIGLLVLPVYSDYTYNGYTQLMAALSLCTTGLLFIGVRFLLRTTSTPFKNELRIGYFASIVLSTLYCSVLDWRWTSLILFICGLLLTAVTYMEVWPFAVTIALLFGYASLFKFTSGLGLHFVAEMSIFIVLTQLIYWLLIASRLNTVRARYARDLQIVIAGILPIIGIAYPGRPVVAISLFAFAALLLKEWWGKGQAYRECALLTMHSSLLWILYTAGVREFQIYSQSTALVMALFAWWRRALEDKYQTINAYLWTAILIFTIPMVLQAITSSNPLYAYLVLIEHTFLIIVSILFKRAAFTWWSIAVIVASVLYQLRTFRYAALAFLGMFIISLAVYFLLRYNKPDETS